MTSHVSSSSGVLGHSVAMSAVSVCPSVQRSVFFYNVIEVITSCLGHLNLKNNYSFTPFITKTIKVHQMIHFFMFYIQKLHNFHIYFSYTHYWECFFSNNLNFSLHYKNIFISTISHSYKFSLQNKKNTDCKIICSLIGYFFPFFHMR